jgi:two-component system phosphate regulon response regulator PhoB
VRGALYTFGSFSELNLLLEAGGDEQEIELPRSEGLRDGEWVLATFCVGDESTAVAACAVDRGDGLRLAFSDRDWERLWQFANSEDPPTIPPPSTRIVGAVDVPPGLRVLVVDDDPDIQGVVTTLLIASGFSACAVASAEDAFDRMRVQPADLLVVDWNLPGMTGLEFCRRLRRDRSTFKVPVLFLTAHSSTQDVVAAFEAGADDFVTKPFRAPELGARVMSLLRRARALGPPPSSSSGA